MIYTQDIDENMKDILIITTENCPMCKRLKKELDRNGVIYRTLDAENDIDGMAHVQFYGLNGSVLPRVIINEELLPVYDDMQGTLNAVLRAIRSPAVVGQDVRNLY